MGLLRSGGGGCATGPGSLVGTGSYKLWRVWGIAALVTLALLAGKLHHEYYWLVLAPVAAVGVGSSLDRLASGHGVAARAVAAALVLLCWLQVRSTWRTPLEWESLERASHVVATTVAGDVWVVAPEAVLFQADRRGCRLEWTPRAVRRAAGEWGVEPDVQDAIDLVESYRRRGARYFADLGGRAIDPRRKVLHDAVRRRYKVIVDRPEVIIADLVIAEMCPHAN
jgi:hypothetical protein